MRAGSNGRTSIRSRRTGNQPALPYAPCVGKSSWQAGSTSENESIAAVPAPIGAALRKGEVMPTLEEKMDAVLNDPVNHPSYYNGHNIEVIDFLED